MQVHHFVEIQRIGSKIPLGGANRTECRRKASHKAASSLKHCQGLGVQSFCRKKPASPQGGGRQGLGVWCFSPAAASWLSDYRVVCL